MRVNHIAIAVPDVQAAAARFSAAFAVQASPPQSLEEHGVSVVFMSMGNTVIELMEPFGASSPIESFLRQRPEGGIHHISLETEDLTETADRVKSLGVRLLGQSKPGAHGTEVIFLHPKDMFGTLFELEQSRS